MAQEVELKFTIEAPVELEDLETLLTSAGFAVRALGAKPQRDVYFDTPLSELANAGYALRRRGTDDEELATLKGRGAVSEGLHRREEVELPMPTESWPEAIHRRLLELIDPSSLEPTVEIATTRHRFLVSEAGKPLAECSLDEVGARQPEGLRHVRFIELEIEALEGGVEDLNRIAEGLKTKLSLQPSALTKLERAQGLLKD